MKTYISILRGINIGGHKMIKMEALRQLYVSLGYDDVQSYIQSGNVIFRTSEINAQILEKTISEKILRTFGFEVRVLALTVDELRNALEKNPFRADLLKDSKKMHLTFLSAVPEKTYLDSISPSDYAPDEFWHSGRIIYVHCPTGYGNTKLTTNFFENKLKLTATSRNMKTATELLAIAEKI
ncbi:MAG TPA: DUF1697 domain-containing protein [Paludibacter sp.]|nr:DUF1697 domain-containing protein [Paludibacter sp.]